MNTFLLIAGIALEVVELAEGATLFSGEEVRTDNNTLRIVALNPKRTWNGTLREMTPAEFTTFRNAILLGLVTLTGDAVGGDSLTVRAKITAAPYVYLPNGGHMREVAFTAEQA
jgi:hypothetical protein